MNDFAGIKFRERTKNSWNCESLYRKKCIRLNYIKPFNNLRFILEIILFVLTACFRELSKNIHCKRLTWVYRKIFLRNSKTYIVIKPI